MKRVFLIFLMVGAIYEFTTRPELMRVGRSAVNRSIQKNDRNRESDKIVKQTRAYYGPNYQPQANV